MQHIERLLIRARKATGGEGMRILGFVEYRPDLKKFTCSGFVWDGVPGSVSDDDHFYSEHDTAEAATAYADSISAKYPGSENITFIVDDLTFPAQE